MQSARGFLFGALSTIAVSLVVEFVTGSISKRLAALRIRILGKRVPTYDCRQDDLFMVAEWSPNRVLEPHRLRTEHVSFAARPAQPWIDNQLWAEAVMSRTADSGSLCYLTRARIDHRESPETQFCYIQLAPSDYAEVRAIEQLRTVEPGLLAPCDDAVARNASEYLESAVPNALTANVVVVTDNLEVLCVRRSAAVDTAVGMWTVGVNENMKPVEPNNPGRDEDFFSITYRALAEELNLYPPDVDDIFISWLGIYRPLLRGHLVSIAKLKVGREIVMDRVRTAESSYEADAMKWIQLNRKTVKGFLAAPSPRSHKDSHAAFELNGGVWVNHARLAFLEAWRYRGLL